MGFLIYVIIIIRADAARTLGKLTEFLTNLSLIHQKTVNRAFIYLYKIKILAIEYSAAAAADNQQIFLYFNNAIFADDIFIR